VEICALCAYEISTSQRFGATGAISFSLGAIVAWRYWSLAGRWVLATCFQWVGANGMLVIRWTTSPAPEGNPPVVALPA